MAALRQKRDLAPPESVFGQGARQPQRGETRQNSVVQEMLAASTLRFAGLSMGAKSGAAEAAGSAAGPFQGVATSADMGQLCQDN